MLLLLLETLFLSSAEAKPIEENRERNRDEENLVVLCAKSNARAREPKFTSKLLTSSNNNNSNHNREGVLVVN